MSVLILDEDDLRKALTSTDVIPAIEEAFRSLANGGSAAPGVIRHEIPGKRGERRIRGAHLKGGAYTVVKSAVCYSDNPTCGLGSSLGFFAVLEADTGALRALLYDNSFLTHVRTGAAGAIAAKYLARKQLNRVAILGCGTQGRFQVYYLRRVRDVKHIAAWDLNRDSAEKFKWEIEEETDAEVTVEPDAESAVRGSDCIVTVTPSRRPFLMAGWIKSGMHITAVGADSPEKQELDERVFAIADVIVADLLEQCVERGDIHHAIAGKVITAKDVAGEIGDLVSGRIPGRTSDDEVTVCDLTGLAVQDAAIANLVLAKSIEMGLGKEVPV